jgi:hypothetical protein
MGNIMDNYMRLVHKRCKIKGTNDEVVVVCLHHTFPSRSFPEGRVWAYIEGESVERGARVLADRLELV